MAEGHATALARAVVAELVAQGVTDLVLAPGARSAPLAYAALAADGAGRLRLHVRLDERSAGFLALGLAKGAGRPVAVLTTSGTAVANLHPAVLEAATAYLPLVLLTASRPRALVHTGANQTLDQTEIFGRSVRAYAALADLTADERTWRFETARLVAAATGVRTNRPGPVQLNLELSEPLTPAGPEAALPTGSRPDRPLSDRPLSHRPLSVAPIGPAGPPTELPAGPRTVIVAGDAPPAAGREVAALGAAAGVPVLAEPSSNARSGPAALGTGRLLAASRLADEVERVVVFGHPTLSRPVGRLLARDDVELVVVSPYADWVDPGRRAGLVTSGVRFAGSGQADPVHPGSGHAGSGHAGSGLPGSGDAGSGHAGSGDAGWLARWQAADAVVRAQLDRLLAGLDYLSGPALAAAVCSALPGDAVLFVGSSSPARDLDLAPVRHDPPPAYANRGLAGIDGNISTAAGLALATGRPTTALLGDLTALHDLTGLLRPATEPRPDLRVLVANDGGGSIFATLEPGGPAPPLPAAYERLFGTPHPADFAALAAGLGVRHARVADLAGLAAVLARPVAGVELVEVVVDRSRRRDLDAAITGLAATL